MALSNDEQLFQAIFQGDLKTVRDLLEHGVNVNVTDNDEETALSHAIQKRHTDMVALLLASGADVNKPLTYGYTHLMLAEESAIARLLLDAGADPHLQNKNGETALAVVLGESAPNIQLVRELLRSGVDANRPRADGWTPLMLAAASGDEAIIQLLLDAGANINAAKDDGETTALIVAEYQQHIPTVKLLLQHGAEGSQEVIRRVLGPILQGIIQWYQQYAPRYYEYVCAVDGATQDAIDHLETELHMQLPTDFRCYLHYSNGGIHFREYEGMSIAKILDWWKMLKEHKEQHRFDHTSPHELPENNQLVRFTWWDTGWVPFAVDGCGNLYCIDLAPEEYGARGQVIAWETESGPCGPYAFSFLEYLRRYRDALLAGKYVYDDDGLYLA